MTDSSLFNQKVYDDLAIADAQGIYRFLQKRGYIQGYDDQSTAPLLLREASPLTGVDMVEVKCLH